jgi:two-component system sensor kinase FixL
MESGVMDENKSKEQLIEESSALRRQVVRLQEPSDAETGRLGESLREDAARFQAILDTTVDGMITINEEGIVQSFNRAAERIFGYAASEVIGRNVSMLMPSPYRENHDGYVKNYLRTGVAKIIGIGREAEGRRKDGSTFPLYLAVSEVRVGERRLFTGILRDISELKQAIEEIRSLARFPNENPFPTLRAARDGTLLYANRGSGLLLQTWGCEVGGLLPDPWRSIVSESLSSGATKEIEVQCGRTTYSLALTPILNADDVNIYGRDITGRKNLEEELRRANDELEQRVQKRTAELAAVNNTLHDYALKLEFRNKELVEFAHIASHDLQEPLRKIRTFADWLKKRYSTVLDDEGEDRLERLAKAASRMQALVHALLDYSRVASKVETFSPVDFGGLVREVILDLQESIAETGGVVEIGELPVIDADAVQMRSLFLNLIVNALKYRRAESPIIKIYSSSSSDGNSEIYVEDNGIGFDEMYLDRIFRPFQQLHKNGCKGTGIGLTICRKVVDRHEGSITARSTPGKGSTFIISLPIRHSVRKSA